LKKTKLKDFFRRENFWRRNFEMKRLACASLHISLQAAVCICVLVLKTVVAGEKTIYKRGQKLNKNKEVIEIRHKAHCLLTRLFSKSGMSLR
jgi:hypothetical protein